jgi:hypothetical protein
MDHTQENIGKKEAQLRRWGARLDEIVTKAEKAGIEVNAAKRQRVDEAMAKCQTAQSKLNEYKTAGCEKLQRLETGVESAWSDLESVFKKLND